MIGELNGLLQRIGKAASDLDGLRQKAVADRNDWEEARLGGKKEGVLLAESYVRELLNEQLSVQLGPEGITAMMTEVELDVALWHAQTQLEVLDRTIDFLNDGVSSIVGAKNAVRADSEQYHKYAGALEALTSSVGRLREAAEGKKKTVEEILERRSTGSGGAVS